MYARFANLDDANRCVAFLDSLYTTMQTNPPVVFPRVVDGQVAHRTCAWEGADANWYVGFDSYSCAFLIAAKTTNQIEGVLSRAGLSPAWLTLIEALLALDIQEIPAPEMP